MDVLDISDSWRDGTATARVRIRPSGQEDSLVLWYRFRGLSQPLDGLAEAVTAGLVIPCMFEGEPLSVPGGLSADLVTNVTKAQQILRSWHDELSPVAIMASQLDHVGAQQSGTGVACCFSGGVDSWYSLLNHEARVSHLLLVRGFDISLDNDVLWSAAIRYGARAAEGLGKQLITCETNLREIADKRRARWGRRFQGDFWGQCLHGAALASVALALRQTVGELIIPATHTYAQMKPWGSSPLLDHLWSDGYLDITHDGCEANRVEKVRLIADSDLALETLRVCYHDTSEINCGHCEKCLRTMMALHVCGALSRAKTFPHHLPVREIHSLIVPTQVRHHYVTLQKEAQIAGDKEVLKATEIILKERLSLHQVTAQAKRVVRATAPGRMLLRLRNRGRLAASPSATVPNTGR
jgi:hypothetical protein